MRIQHLAFLISVVAATSMCGGSGGDSTTGPGAGGTGGTGGSGNPYGDPGVPPAACTPGNGVVCLTVNNTFNPASITVTAGSSVTWNNSTGITHTVTFTTPGVVSDSTPFPSGTRSMTFATAGTFQYHCLIHGTVMSGTVIVQ